LFFAMRSTFNIPAIRSAASGVQPMPSRAYSERGADRPGERQPRHYGTTGAGQLGTEVHGTAGISYKF